ncbi:MAG: hypothetical protein HY435_03275 [Candidatus Liptonbacteria bacterium]|nr:hypothetical protein [Candidatus Liptonbacteria bacterium]
MCSVLLVGVDHVYEHYRIWEGPRKRHRKFLECLHRLVPTATRLACVVEEGGSGLAKEEELQSGQDDSIPRDFALSRGARFRFADLDLVESRRLLGGRHPRDVTPQERKALHAARERTIAKAVFQEARKDGCGDLILVVCGADHMPGIRKELGDDLNVDEKSTLSFGWQHVNPFDPEE